jgi:hypothetical protein
MGWIVNTFATRDSSTLPSRYYRSAVVWQMFRTVVYLAAHLIIIGSTRVIEMASGNIRELEYLMVT